MNLIGAIQPFVAVTEDVKISVRPIYVDGQSDSSARKFMFSYFIRVENNGKEPVQLLRRRWFINHNGGRVEEIEGEGVIGKQPTIPPGEAFEYNSFCILETFDGWMEGTFLMRRESGEYFRAAVPRFMLRAMAN